MRIDSAKRRGVEPRLSSVLVQAIRPLQYFLLRGEHKLHKTSCTRCLLLEHTDPRRSHSPTVGSTKLYNMKLGFALARLSSTKSPDVEPAAGCIDTQEPAYTLLNDQTWSAVFSWLSTTDLARSRVGMTAAPPACHGRSLCTHSPELL